MSEYGTNKINNNKKMQNEKKKIRIFCECPNLPFKKFNYSIIYFFYYYFMNIIE